MSLNWLPIDTAPVNAEKPFLVYLPNRDVVVSALPLNVMYAEDGNTAIGWDGDPMFTMTDSGGGFYGMRLDEKPTLWRLSPVPK